MSKAYDVLDHNILLFKLEAYGIRGLVNQWFKTYLSNQKRYIEIKYMGNNSQNLEKFTSSLKEMKSGVPQGSVLGPVLFADDTNVQIEATNANILNEKIKEVVQQLLSWFSANKLVINTDKTIVISFHAWKIKVT